MKPSQTIFLRPGDVISIDGVEMTYQEVKENKIDSVIFRKHLKESQAVGGGAEWVTLFHQLILKKSTPLCVKTVVMQTIHVGMQEDA